jgi:hypothetical protein
MTSALDEVAAAADQVANEQRLIARTARAMQRRRDRGQSWSTILDGEPVPGIMQRLRSSARRLAEATGRFALALASGLHREGESHRGIARRLGVSHQRVTTLLNELSDTTAE